MPLEEEKKGQGKPADSLHGWGNNNLGAKFASQYAAKDEAEKETSAIVAQKKAKNKLLKKVNDKKDQQIVTLEEENAKLTNDMAAMTNNHQN